VSRIEITRSRWDISPKIQVGMLKNDVEKILGTPLHEEERQDGKVWVWWWHGNSKFDSLFSVTFEKGKAVMITLSEDTSL
jgi:outer membrane protein assembly factor BamE (lipoprotein component of BamABCDE complex)